MGAPTRIAIILGLGAAAAGAGIWATGATWEDITHMGQPRNVLEIEGQEIRVPQAQTTGERLSPAVAVSTTGEHSFLFTEDEEPTRYDPCMELAWVHNPAGMPDGAEGLVASAVADIETYTGLAFSYEGEVDEVAHFDRALIQEEYGDRFAPIIIGWSDEESTPDLAGSTAGLGGSSSVTGAYGDQRFLAAGVVILDTEDLGELLGESNGSERAESIIRHELAHVVGLGHVEDSTELMHAENMAAAAWGPGDRQGLAIAGAGPCQ
ncbi:hypothetical protein [Demequina flava]|uniref:hypothetical protein n=1 Tax=Demequina flava TaxID=1095025 RepID=UPI00078305BD|nr:hypothetical protein [Demequina flava]